MNLSTNIFPEKTTYKSDYTVKQLPKMERYNIRAGFVPKPKKEIKPRPYVGTFMATLQPLCVPLKKLPFNTTWDPKPIVQVDASKQTFCKLPKMVDPDKDFVIKTRPRLKNMGPAINMDDIPKDVRDKMCDEIYISEQQRLMKEGENRLQEKVLQYTTHEANTYPVRNQYKFLEVERINYPTKYENIRTVKCDKVPFERDLYWPKNKILPHVAGQDPFAKAISEDERKEIRELIEKDELRMYYDILHRNYGGHRPRYIGERMKKNKIHDRLSI